MSQYPLGGIEITNQTLGAVGIFDLVFLGATFAGVGAAITTYPEGMILARVTAAPGGTIGDLRPWVFGGANGLEIPVGVLNSDVVTDAVPTDIPIRFIGSGQVRQGRLVEGSAAIRTNIDFLLEDQLRSFGIIPLNVLELTEFDNPQP